MKRCWDTSATVGSVEPAAIAALGGSLTPGTNVDLRLFKSELSFSNKLIRVLWGMTWICLFRPTPRLLHGWRRFLLRLFGARIGRQVRVDSSVQVFFPPNLDLGDHVVIGPKVELYCVAPIVIGENSMVSQYSYLCAATHDYRQPNLPLVPGPITIGKETWICAQAFIGPNVQIGDRTVVGARAVVVKSIAGQVIVAGNPARVIKHREPATADSIPTEELCHKPLC